MRKLALVIASVLCCFSAASQGSAALKELKSLLDTCCVQAKYSYGDASGKELGSGIAKIQGHKYLVTEGKAVFICNGSTLWSMFNDTKEIYIEKAGGAGDIFGNLDSILSQVKDLKYDGRKVTFKLDLPGNQPLLCKAVIDKMPFNPDAKFEVEQGVLQSREWTVTDLR